MSLTVQLPEPSGPITHHATVQNSYGGRGCYYVGKTEIEDPAKDIDFYSQILADAYAALEYENVTKIDLLAAHARAAYHQLDDAVGDWHALSDDYKKRWRAVVRLLKTDAP